MTTHEDEDLSQKEASPPKSPKPKRGSPAPESRSHLPPLTAEQRLFILDSWQRSELSAEKFAPLVGVTTTTLYGWKKRFESHGPAGLSDRKRGQRPGSRLSEPVQRAVLMLKRAHPDWGCDRLHDVLLRSEGYGASPSAIARFLKEQGYVSEVRETREHPPPVRRFERAKTNQLWQSDLFTFLLKRLARRVYLVVFMDDFSRFIVGYGVHASSSGALVRETLEAAIARHGLPEEVLTDNGTQYKTWRGKSAFTKLLERRGIRHVVARPRHPQTLGKVERFWGSLWRECVEKAVFHDIDDARRRVGLYIDHYNFHRPHQGIEGLVPADRFFAAEPEVKQTLTARVSQDAAQLAREGLPRKSFYLTGRVGDESIALHAEGSRVVLTKEDGAREEVDLRAEGPRLGRGQEAGLPEPLAACALFDEETRDEEQEDGTEDAAGERDGEAPRGADPGDSLRAEGADGSRGGAGHLADPLLPAGDAGPAGADPRAGAQAPGRGEEPGEGAARAAGGDRAPDAGAQAQRGAGAGRAEERGPAAGEAQDPEDEEDPAGRTAGQEGAQGAASAPGDGR